MPNYQHIPIESELNDLKKKIEVAKTKNTYEREQNRWDQAVMLTVKKWCTAAENHRQIHANYVMQRRNKCKELIDGVESQLKKKELIAGEYTWIENQPAVIARLAKESNDDSVELVHALLEYRSGWPSTARDSLSEDRKSMLEPFTATRQKGINQEDKVLIGYRKRCDEYAIRAEEFAKQAVQRQKKGAVNVDEFNRDAAEIKQKMVAAHEKIEDDRQKKHRVFTFFEKNAAKKNWPDEDKKQAGVYFPQIQYIAKEARGTVKTLTTLLDGLEARGKAAGPGWKDIAAKAVKEAKADYLKAKASAESLTKEEEACSKTFQKMK